MMEALASLPPKMICLAEDAPPQEVTLEAGNLATRVATVKSRIDKAIFTTTSDKQKVLSLYEDYVKRIARALQSTLGLAGAEAVELALPAPPSVDAPTANPLRLADGQLMLYLPDAKSHRAGSEGRSQICVVRDERIVSALLGTAVQIELLVVGGNAELHLDSCSQVVLPWWPPVEGWAAAFQPEVTKLLGLKEQTLGLNEKVKTAEKVAKRAQEAQAKEAHAANEAKEAAAASQAAQAEAKEAKEEAKEAVERLANATEVKEDVRQESEELVQRIAARVSALQPTFTDVKMKKLQDDMEMEALRKVMTDCDTLLNRVRWSRAFWLGGAGRSGPLPHEASMILAGAQVTRLKPGHVDGMPDDIYPSTYASDMLVELQRCVSITQRWQNLQHLHPDVLAALAAHFLRATRAAGERRYALGQWLTIRKPDGQWSDMQVGIDKEPPLHPWNHAPRELPHTDFEKLRLWWMQTLRLQHSHIADALTGNRLDVMEQCVAINMAGTDSEDIRDAQSLSEWLSARHTDLCSGHAVDVPTDRAIQHGLSTGHAALLTGPPASGKTSLISQVVVHLLSTELVPVLIKVQRLQRSLIENPEAFGMAWNWVDAYLRIEHQHQPAVYHFLRQALLARRVLLLLDGLDEGGTSRGEIEKHVTQVLAPQGHVMLCTSRPAGLHAERFDGFRRLKLSPLSEGQQQQALQQRLGGVVQAQSLLEYVKTQLPLDEDGLRMTANPLMLSMVASVYQIRQGVGMPETVTELYRDATEKMLSRGGAASLGLRKLLQAVFFEAHVSQQREISEARLEAAAERSKVSNELLDEFRSRAMEDQLPLVSLLTTKPLLLQSSHLSFQEYFAARALCEMGTRLSRKPPWQWSNAEDVKNDAFTYWSPWWANTLKLGEGMGEDFGKGLLCAAGMESDELDLTRQLNGGGFFYPREALLAVIALLVGLSKLNLQQNTIGDRDAAIIAGRLKSNTSLTVLSLASNGISIDGASAIADALRANSSLTSLDVCKNNVTGKGGQQLAEAVLSNQTLKMFCHIPLKELRADELTTLDLELRGIGVPGALVLAELLQTVSGSLTNLNLGGCDIGAEGGVAIAEVLRVNGSLRYLFLQKNNIGVVGASAIASALEVNGSLISLNLAENELGPKGGMAVAEALRLSSSLTEVNLKDNNLGEVGWCAIFEVLRDNKDSQITKWDLSNQRISPTIVKSLVAYAAVSSLTSLNLYNAEAEAEVRRCTRQLRLSRSRSRS